MSYANFLSKLLAYGDLIRQHWPLILAAYNALKAVYDALGVEIPGEGTLQMVAATDDELNAEERLAFLIDGDSPAVSSPGRFRKIFEFLKATGLLDKLLGGFLGS
jgi:hypothetical protein